MNLSTPLTDWLVCVIVRRGWYWPVSPTPHRSMDGRVSDCIIIRWAAASRCVAVLRVYRVPVRGEDGRAICGA